MPALSALIPLDGTQLSESAFDLLAFLKQIGVSRLVLLSVWENTWGEEHGEIPGREEGAIQEVSERGQSYLNAYLDKQAERARAAGLEVETVVRLGRAAEEAIEYAESNPVDLLVMATHGRSGIARFRLGSVADEIVRHSPCPDLIIGPNVEIDLASYAIKRVLVPLDGSALAEQALPVAKWIARATGAGIDLVRAVSITPIAYDDSMGVYPIDLLTAMEEAAKTYLDRIASEIGGDVRTSLLIGSAGDQILEYMKENPVDLVVMAAHGRGPVRRLVLGSATDRVLHGPAPVLVLRPEDAKSGLLEAARDAAAG